MAVASYSYSELIKRYEERDRKHPFLNAIKINEVSRQGLLRLFRETNTTVLGWLCGNKHKHLKNHKIADELVSDCFFAMPVGRQQQMTFDYIPEFFNNCLDAIFTRAMEDYEKPEEYLSVLIFHDDSIWNKREEEEESTLHKYLTSLPLHLRNYFLEPNSETGEILLECPLEEDPIITCYKYLDILSFLDIDNSVKFLARNTEEIYDVELPEKMDTWREKILDECNAKIASSRVVEDRNT